MTELLPYLLPAILSAATLLVGWIMGYKKNKAETTVTELGAVEKAVKIWRELSESTLSELKDLRKEYIEVRLGHATLQREHESLQAKYEGLQKKYETLERDHDMQKLENVSQKKENEQLKQRIKEFMDLNNTPSI